MTNLKKVISLLMVVVMLGLTSVSAFATEIVKPTTTTVLDSADILSEETENEIDSVNAKLGETCKIYIVTVTNTDGQTEQDYAKNLFANWEIGGKIEQKGILYFITLGRNTSVGPSYYSIVGRGISKGFDNNGLANIINNDVEPLFAQGEYDDAVMTFLSKTNAIIEKENEIIPTATKAPTKTTGVDFGGILRGVGIFLLILIIIILVAGIAFNIHAENIHRKKRAARANGQGRRRTVSSSQHKPLDDMRVTSSDEFEDIHS